MAGGARVEGRHLSAGTLTAMAILLGARQLRAASGITYILIDELGSDLHPRAQHALVQELSAMIDATPHLRLLATTHSPFVMDGFALDDVRIMSLDSAGTTHVSRLAEHEHWAKWKDTMLPGEFWTWAGESWVSKNVGR